MSSISNFTNMDEQQQIGEAIPVHKNGYVPQNYVSENTVLSQSTYPELYSKVGLIKDGLDYWNIKFSYTGNYVLTLTYGNGIYIAGGDFGTMWTSTDAITWTSRTTGVSVDITALTYGTVFVYGTISGNIRTSTNGVTWTARTSGTTSSINALAYGNGIYVYAGAGGVLRTSADAITWTSRTSGTVSDIYALTYGNGIFVYAGMSGVLRTSTNGITWTSRTSGTTYDIYALAYGNGIYVYAGYFGVLATSTDAITWTVINPGTTGYASAELTYGNGVFVLAHATSLKISSDGVNWLEKNKNTIADINSLTYGNGKFVYGGNLFFQGSLNIGIASEYTYNTSTEFILPKISKTDSILKQYKFYVKAS